MAAGLCIRKEIEVWVEQCFRDVLRVTWELDRPDNLTQFLQLVPPEKELQFCFVCCQQFLLSREQMRRRPLAVWKKLYQVGQVRCSLCVALTCVWCRGLSDRRRAGRVPRGRAGLP